MLRDDAALGEGAAVFTVQQDPAEGALAELLACEVRFTPDPRQYAEGLANVVSRALDRSGVRPEEVTAVSLGAAHHRGLERIEERGVRAALGGELPRAVRVADVLGETYSASGALQLAALLALWQAEPCGLTGDGARHLRGPGRQRRGPGGAQPPLRPAPMTAAAPASLPAGAAAFSADCP